MDTKVVPSALIFMVALLSGCSSKLEVQSSTCWEGYVRGASVADCGNQTWQARGGECYTFQKTTDVGSLRARVEGWKGDGSWKETTAPYGVVTVCSRP